MRILFIHQNFPGQYKHLAAHMAARPDCKVMALCTRKDQVLQGVPRLVYTVDKSISPGTHDHIAKFEEAVKYGERVAMACEELKRRDFVPDLICAHPGWGEAMYLRDVFPDARQLHYCEFFFHGHGAQYQMDPAAPLRLDSLARTRVRNMVTLFSLNAMDWGLSPTRWQHHTFPREFHNRISVVFDGIETGQCRPDPDARLTLPDGRVLTAADEVVTYVSRNLEPARGFPQFIRALPDLLARRPNAKVVILGGDDVSYSPRPDDAACWREKMLAEVPLDPERVLLLGKMPYANYLKLLRISACHVYLTVPFVLSWSMIEAMSSGCAIVASDTPPVREVIEDGRNGLLVPLYDSAAIAERVADVLASPDRRADLRAAARETVLARYDLAQCLPAQVKMLEDLVEGRTPAL